MKQSLLALLMLPALLAMTSCASMKKSPPVVVQPIVTTPVICPAEAFIDLTKYELPDPPKRLNDTPEEKRKQDMAFRKWQAAAIAKYPELKNAYALLVNCWFTYHPVKK